MKELAPIVLFVYNRPWHTKQTLNALVTNDLADQSVLYVYADGAKVGSSQDQKQKIDETRELVKGFKGFKEIFLVESSTNIGLADSIVTGVTDIINKYGKVIVLEDDIVTSRGFLSFMNESLRIYEKDSQVMHVSAYSYPIAIPTQFFLYPGGTCWGWGTWARAWGHLNRDASYHAAWIKNKKLIDVFNFNGSKQFYDQILWNVSGANKTWAILWRASIFEHQGCTFYPPVSLTRNIGTDGHGTNLEKDNFLLKQEITDFYKPHKEVPSVSKDINRSIYRYYNSKNKKGSFWSNLTQFIKI